MARNVLGLGATNWGRQGLATLFMCGSWLTLPAQEVLACGFARGADNSFVSLTGELYRPRTRFDGGGKVRQALSEFDQTVLRIFGETGISDQVTLNVNTAFFDNTNRFDADGGQVTQSSTGLGDIELGARYTWGEGPFISGQVTALIPPGYDTDNALPLGFGEFGYDLSVGLANDGVVGETPFFVDSCFTFRDYTGDAGSRLKLGLSAGLDLSESIQLIGGMDGDFSLGNGVARLSNGNPTLDPDFDNLEVNGRVNFRVAEDVRVGVGGFHYVAGRNVAAGGGFTVNLWVDF